MEPQKKFFKKVEKAEKPSSLKVTKQKAFSVTLTGLVVTGVVLYMGFTMYSFTSKLSNSWNAISFAFEYPELVEPLQHQYQTETNALKDSLVKRQAFISPLAESEATQSAKKVAGQ